MGESTAASPCIEWQGWRNRAGYGYRRFEGKTRLAHRVAYANHHGLLLPALGGKVVRHTCDNPACVNPEHLLLGTQRDNMNDVIARQRVAGERNGYAKLTAEQVRAIRTAYQAGGISQRTLGTRYGVAQTTIGFIVRGVSWPEEEQA